MSWYDKMATAQALAFATVSRSRFLEERKDLVRVPSVSAQPRDAQEMKRCAAWLAGHLRRIGLDGVQVVATKGHLLVYGAWLQTAGKPTPPIYGQNNVQPVDPLDAWRSRPFGLVVRGDNPHGRGAADDKGQLFAHADNRLQALWELLGSLHGVDGRRMAKAPRRAAGAGLFERERAGSLR